MLVYLVAFVMVHL